MYTQWSGCEYASQLRRKAETCYSRSPCVTLNKLQGLFHAGIGGGGGGGITV